MTPLRRAELDARYAKIQALIAQAGSVHKAAKAIGMDRANFIRARRQCLIGRQLTPPPPPRTS